MNRRDFCICSLGAVSLGAFMHNRSGFAIAPGTDTQSSLPPIRAITRGPRFHWRGYYDKNLFDPSDRYVLANEIDFEGRTPNADDVLRVGMIDLQNNDACCNGYQGTNPRFFGTIGRMAISSRRYSMLRIVRLELYRCRSIAFRPMACGG